MRPTKEQLEAYKEMAKTSPDSMKAMIEANLKATCDKYAGHEDRLDDCIDYLTKCAKEILDHKNGEVDNETCYRICRDYFNDELWAKEDEEKAERDAKRKAGSRSGSRLTATFSTRQKTEFSRASSPTCSRCSNSKTQS